MALRYKKMSFLRQIHSEHAVREFPAGKAVGRAGVASSGVPVGRGGGLGREPRQSARRGGLGREPPFSGSRPMDFTAKPPKSRQVAQIFASPSAFQSRNLGHISDCCPKWHRFRRPRWLFSASVAHRAYRAILCNRKERRDSPPLQWVCG